MRGCVSFEPSRIYSASLRLLAAECALFTEEVDLNSERWQVYVNWVENILCPGDVVVSFNYDPVFDIIMQRCNTNLWIPLPEEAEYRKDAVNVLKLHGSTEWSFTKDDKLIRDPNRGYLGSLDITPGMGVPGIEKSEIVNKAFIKLWKIAMKAIREIPQVYVLGYGFPQSDAMARSALLRAIGESQEPRQVRAVLGPSSPRMNAVRSMVKLVCGARGEFEAIPNYVEEFLSAIPNRKALH